MIDRDKFFALARVAPFGGVFEQVQVDGLNTCLDAWASVSDVRWTAYALATAFKETNRSMQPVREAYYLGEPHAENYRRTLSYYPFYGRGYVQLTWQANYKKLGDLVGIDLVANPDRVLESKIAADIMVRGMVGGLFTGRKLADYFSVTRDDPVDARWIINGQDCAAEIAGYHGDFLKALEGSTQ